MSPSPVTVSDRRRRIHVGRVAGLVVATSLCWLPTAGAAPAKPNPSGDAKLRELQNQREKVRSASAKSAASVNALKASDAEVRKALDTLDGNIAGQSAMLDDAESSVKAAEDEQAAAQSAEDAATAKLADLRTSMKSQAIQSYVETPRDDTLDLLSASSLEDVALRQTLRSVQADQTLDAAEEYRKVNEDRSIARAKAAAAADKASQRREEVKARLAKLQDAHDQQEKFAAQVDDRINAALAEADSLAQFDGALAGQIAQREGELARMLAAQRAAAARRGRTTAPPGSVAVPTFTGEGDIVSVNGIRVHQSIASNVAALLAAASADGIQLGGGGFRSPAAQIATRRNNCGSSNYAIYQAPASSCSPPTARPGSSMHERGLAIDFTSGGGTLTRGSAAFAWMKAHAAQYGLYNLPSEPWHWSTNGN